MTLQNQMHCEMKQTRKKKVQKKNPKPQNPDDLGF